MKDREIVFENRDWKKIKELLLEIGNYRYESALENMKLSHHRPLTMKYFFLQATEHCTFLCILYPSGYSARLMKVDEYRNLPKDGWTRREIKYGV